MLAISSLAVEEKRGERIGGDGGEIERQDRRPSALGPSHDGLKTRPHRWTAFLGCRFSMRPKWLCVHGGAEEGNGVTAGLDADFA